MEKLQCHSKSCVRIKGFYFLSFSDSVYDRHVVTFYIKDEREESWCEEGGGYPIKTFRLGSAIHLCQFSVDIQSKTRQENSMSTEKKIEKKVCVESAMSCIRIFYRFSNSLHDRHVVTFYSKDE